MTNNRIYRDKVVVVTGAAGSIGSRLVKNLLDTEVRSVRALDSNENGLFKLAQHLPTERVRTLVGDIRDKDRLRAALEDVDIVFHAAALKHIPLCEYNPFEAVKTNVEGTQNVIEASIENEAERMVLVSTDKACNPSSVLGASKLLAERLTVTANNYKGKRKTLFLCVRFGNVLHSSGSVFETFREQIERGEEVTLTDKEMTRFVMHPNEAVGLILEAVRVSRGGEIFVLKMPALRIVDLAEVMVEEIGPLYGNHPGDFKVRVIGKRPGEKLSEALLTEDEADYARERNGLFVLDTRSGKIQRRVQQRDYLSNIANPLGKREIQNLVRDLLSETH